MRQSTRLGCGAGVRGGEGLVHDSRNAREDSSRLKKKGRRIEKHCLGRLHSHLHDGPFH